jgi:VWFA-related protein
MKRSLVSLSLALACGAGAALIAGGGAGADQQNGQEPPTFRSSVNAVQVSVIVTDASGKPVAGLTQDDFEIVENKQMVPISTFLPVDIPIEGETAVRVERDVLGNDGPPGRLYLIALDTMSGEQALRTRQILRNFIEKHFGPNDTAAVVLTTGGLSGSGQEFTGNARLLLNAIDKFDGGIDAGGGREKNFLGDFRSLMEFMATLHGARKAVIFASTNIPADPYMIVDRPNKLGGIFSDVHPDFVDAISYATRNNIAIYPIDPTQLTTDLSAAGSNDTSELDRRTNLRGLAAITGGFALTGSNNYEAAFERLVEENSTYYVLGFNSSEERRGNYSRVDVHVKRPGLTVHSVEGYVTPRKPVLPLRRANSVLAAAWDAVASATTTSGVPMRAYAASFKGMGKDATVAISLEIAANKLNLIDDNGIHRGDMDILFAVTDAKGKRRPIMRHRAKLALTQATFDRVSHSALRVISELRLPKGRYQIRASAGGAAIAGSVVYDLEIPDYDDDFEISGLSLSSSVSGQTPTVSPYNHLDVAFPGPPTTVREFVRDDRVTLYAEAYENRKKPHTVTMTVELRDTAGRVVGTHSLDRETKDKPKEASRYTFAPTLSLEDVPAGEYVLHVDARSSLDKNKPQVREIPIRVR